MMLPPCFRLAERVFPLVRQEAARRMAEAGLKQAEIGERLGVSQAMVSKYLKQAEARVEEQDEWIVHQMAAEITQGEPPGPAKNGDHPTNPWCRTLALTTGQQHKDRRAIVTGLLSVLRRLQETDPGPLVPAVGMNLAGALPNAQTPSDVAAFPGRLGYVQNTLRAHAPPEFGASNHLAQVLIKAQQEAPTVRWAVNIAGTTQVLQAARRNKQRLVDPETQHRDDAGVVDFRAPQATFVLVDPGGFAIEPALYLFDDDAGSLSRRLEALIARIKRSKSTIRSA
jgi:XRE family transcriptional regulator, thiamine biosynthesis regulator